MEFLEKDLEQIIFENLSDSKKYKNLENRGFCLNPFGYVEKPYWVGRQVKIGNYGTADLIIVIRSMDGPYENHSLDIYVIELKVNVINNDTLLQVSRYMKGVNRYLKNRVKIRYSVKGVMIGKKICTSDYIYLFDDIIDYGKIVVLKYEYGINGLKFNEENLSSYTLIDEGF